MKKLLFLLFIINAQIVFAQIKTVKPEQEGFSSTKLKSIDSMFKAFTTKDHRVAGVAAIVLRHGNVVYHQASGYKNIENNQLLKTDDIFRIASQTKAITAVAVMILRDRGQLALTDPISNYIPEFKNPKVIDKFNAADSSYTTKPASREITIHDLLTHTSGISYRLIGTKEANAIYEKAGIPVGFEAREILLSDAMKKLAKLPIMHQPGEKFTYGLSIDVLGYLIEVITRKSLKDFFQTEIFNPLEMKDTYFYLPKDKQNRLVSIYHTDDQSKTVATTLADSFGDVNPNYPIVNGTYFSGGAGLSSTTSDYASFLQMFIYKGTWKGKRILSEKSIELMTSNQIGNIEVPNTTNKIGYVFTVVMKDGGAYPKGTFEGGGYWGSFYWVDPKNGIIAQIFTQHPADALGEMGEKFKKLIYKALH